MKRIKFLTLLATMFFSGLAVQSVAQSCCSKDKKCCSKAVAEGKSKACTPSNCRGAKTKFSEAAVITELRESLIALKADLEQSEDPVFDSKTYNVHGIVGDSDEESIRILKDEVLIIEEAFVDLSLYNPGSFNLPENKAHQVEYLKDRIDDLHKAL